MSFDVLICDDENERSRRWADQLENSGVLPPEYRVRPLTPGEVLQGIEELEARRSASRGKGSAPDIGDAIFDTADVLVLDFDLFGLDRTISVTGDDVAYLARCYSEARMIVGLNQFGENPFDLTLVDHPDSYADLNIGGSQLANPSLWSVQPPFSKSTAFRPWAWPAIPQFVQTVTTRRKDILNAGGTTTVSELLRIPQQIMDLLPRSAVEFIVGRNQNTRPTLENIARTSGMGFRGNDQPFDDAGSIARISSARLSAWIEHVLIAGQDILVDAPHLCVRFPSLLKAETHERSTPQAWNGTTSLDISASGGLDETAIGTARFHLSHWASRPVWYWHLCNSLPDISEVKYPWAERNVPFVFCEDVSQFRAPEEAREFVSSVDSPYARRYVVDPAHAPQPIADELARVEYSPQVRFASV